MYCINVECASQDKYEVLFNNHFTAFVYLYYNEFVLIVH